VTHDDVRERLPEHLLGTLEGPDDLEVRRHLRGCASCRAEMSKLGEGITAFAAAAHDREPPEELRDRVLGALDDEWRDAPAEQRRSPLARPWLAAAAAFLAFLLAFSWGLGQQRRATNAALDAVSYNTLLHTLGGEDFRVGTLRPTGAQPVDGSVVLYDSMKDQSWGLVMVRAPGMTGSLDVTLTDASGDAIKVRSVELSDSGDGTSWLVTASDIGAYNHVEVPYGGQPIAAAAISSA